MCTAAALPFFCLVKFPKEKSDTIPPDKRRLSTAPAGLLRRESTTKGSPTSRSWSQPDFSSGCSDPRQVYPRVLILASPSFRLRKRGSDYKVFERSGIPGLPGIRFRFSIVRDECFF